LAKTGGDDLSRALRFNPPCQRAAPNRSLHGGFPVLYRQPDRRLYGDSCRLGVRAIWITSLPLLMVIPASLPSLTPISPATPENAVVAAAEFVSKEAKLTSDRIYF
jgi:hypothetical protein